MQLNSNAFKRVELRFFIEMTYSWKNNSGLKPFLFLIKNDVETL